MIPLAYREQFLYTQVANFEMSALNLVLPELGSRMARVAARNGNECGVFHRDLLVRRRNPLPLVSFQRGSGVFGGLAVP